MFGVLYEETRMWANAQRDGRPAKYRWRPLLLLFLRVGVQPTLDPYAEGPFYNRPIALTQEGRSLVNDVCECVRD